MCCGWRLQSGWVFGWWRFCAVWWRLFPRVGGVPMGTDCAPLLAGLCLCSYEGGFLDGVVGGDHRRLAGSFGLCCGCVNDLIVFSGRGFLGCLGGMCRSQLTVERAGGSGHLAGCLGLTFVVDSGGELSTRLYDKCDDFNFHVVSFPYLSSSMPSGPSCGVCISQLVGYA